MTRRIFRAIVAVALTSLTAAMCLVFWAVYDHFTRVQFAQLREETALTAHAVQNQGASYFEGLGAQLTSRITWIGADGTVLYDSRSDSQSMENHLQRQEVRDALDSGYGHSSRDSGTLLGRYLYTAQRLPDGTVLRLSMSQNTALDLLLSMSQLLALGLILAVVLCFLLAGSLSRQIVRPINAIDLDDPMSNREYEEIRPLLRRLDSQQKQLRAQEAELRRKQKEFNTVTRDLSEGLVLIAADGTILSINPAAAELLEVTRNCLGADFSVANRNSTVGALVDRGLTGEKSEGTAALAGGAYLAVANPVRSQGTVSGVALLLFDVTQRARAEDLRREFTANVSHELKTPIHTISGYAELMQRGLVPSEDMPRFSGKIYAEAQRLKGLVEDILRLSRLDEGAADMQWEDTFLLDQVQSVIRRLKAPAELAGVKLEGEGDPAVVRGIPQLVESILFNLVSNAVKYNRPGGSVRIRVEDQTEKAVVTVTDTGIGIPQEHQSRVFERFYRVDKSHSREVGGTGLGLSIVKHAALILKAEASLKSTPGEGTTVSVSFPKA